MSFKIFSLFSFLIFLFSFANAQVVMMDGVVHANHIRLSGMWDRPHFKTNVFEISLNGKDVNYEETTDTLCIDLKARGFKANDSVHLLIHGHCKVVNWQSFTEHNKYELLNTRISSDTFCFDTQGESAKFTYLIEQYKWNKWITIAEVKSTGTKNKNHYFI